MCLSNVYHDSISEENLILGNVQRIDCGDDEVVLTDLMGREVVVEGRLIYVDLIENRAVVQKIA